MEKVLSGDSRVDIERVFRATRPYSPGYVLEHFVTQFDFFDCGIWVNLGGVHVPTVTTRCHLVGLRCGHIRVRQSGSRKLGQASMACRATTRAAQIRWLSSAVGAKTLEAW